MDRTDCRRPVERKRFDHHTRGAARERIAGVRHVVVSTAEGRDDGYIVALWPPLENFSGDGACNNQDINGFVATLFGS